MTLGSKQQNWTNLNEDDLHQDKEIYIGNSDSFLNYVDSKDKGYVVTTVKDLLPPLPPTPNPQKKRLVPLPWVACFCKSNTVVLAKHQFRLPLFPLFNALIVQQRISILAIYTWHEEGRAEEREEIVEIEEDWLWVEKLWCLYSFFHKTYFHLQLTDGLWRREG